MTVYCSSGLHHYCLIFIMILIPIIVIKNSLYIVFLFYFRNKLWCRSNTSKFAHWMCVFQQSRLEELHVWSILEFKVHLKAIF